MFTTRPTSPSPATITARRMRARAARCGALLATATLCALSTHAASASAQVSGSTSTTATGSVSADTIPNEHRVFELKNAYSGHVADVPDWSSEPGTRIVQWSANGGANQRWRLDGPLDWYGTPVFRIKNEHSGLCLEPVYLPGGVGRVRQGECTTWRTANQLWQFRKNDFGYYTIKNMASLTMLHVSNKTAGSELSLTNEFGVTDRMWDVKETKLPYAKDTASITLPWGQWRSDVDYCDEGWRVELDSGSWNPRYHSIGDAGVKIAGTVFNGVQTKYSLFGFGDMSVFFDTSEYNPRKIGLVYYNNKGTDPSRNYELTARVRFYCVPGTSF